MFALQQHGRVGVELFRVLADNITRATWLTCGSNTITLDRNVKSATVHTFFEVYSWQQNTTVSLASHSFISRIHKVVSSSRYHAPEIPNTRRAARGQTPSMSYTLVLRSLQKLHAVLTCTRGRLAGRWGPRKGPALVSMYDLPTVAVRGKMMRVLKVDAMFTMFQVNIVVLHSARSLGAADTSQRGPWHCQGLPTDATSMNLLAGVVRLLLRRCRGFSAVPEASI